MNEKLSNGNEILPFCGNEVCPLTEEKGKEMLKANIPNKEAAIWLVLADMWLKSILS